MSPCMEERMDLYGAPRRPYVGEGVDGALRSAEIDRNEADTLDPGERRDACLASAAQWEAQAAAPRPAGEPYPGECWNCGKATLTIRPDQGMRGATDEVVCESCGEVQEG